MSFSLDLHHLYLCNVLIISHSTTWSTLCADKLLALQTLIRKRRLKNCTQDNFLSGVVSSIPLLYGFLQVPSVFALGSCFCAAHLRLILFCAFHDRYYLCYHSTAGSWGTATGERVEGNAKGKICKEKHETGKKKHSSEKKWHCEKKKISKQKHVDETFEMIPFISSLFFIVHSMKTLPC